MKISEIVNIDQQILIVQRLEEKFGLVYSALKLGKPVGELAFNWLEYNLYIEIPYYNKEKEKLFHLDGGVEVLPDYLFVVKFGDYPLVGTKEQIRNACLYTAVLSACLEISKKDAFSEKST